MKIIAKCDSNKFLVEATAEEIKFLAGKEIGWHDYNNEHFCSFGTQFNIVKAFEQIHRNDKRKREIESLRATLNAMLVGLDMIEPLIEEPKPQETVAEV